MPNQNEVQAANGAGSSSCADSYIYPTSGSGTSDTRTSSVPSDNVSSTDNQNQNATAEIGLTSGNNSDTLAMFKQISQNLREAPGAPGLPHVIFEGLCDEPDAGGHAPAKVTEKDKPADAQTPVGETPDTPTQQESPEDLPQVSPPPPLPYFEPLPTSENPFIRNKLREQNIDPTKTNGIKIGIIEEDFDDPNGHGAEVESIINDHDFGLIPDSHPERIIRPNVEDPNMSDYAGKPDGLDHFITDYGRGYLDRTTSQIENIVSRNDPDLRVLNLSYGVDNTLITQNSFAQMYQHPEDNKEFLTELLGKEKADQFIDLANEGKQDPSLTTELMQAIKTRVDTVVENSSKIAEGKDKYRAATKQAAEHGITLCVACGNSQDDFNSLPGIDLKPGEAFNWYAQSEHVIAVGATDIGETAGNRRDDKITGFSSHGNDTYQPTVVAPGRAVQIHSNDDSGVSGTSFATPEVAATVALMLAQNPNMTFEQIRTALQNNTTKIPNTSNHAQGAGILIPEDAIIASQFTD